ncbi:hypothetical protein Syun_025365 [Stephania yunnanensis]|uniref:Uncharacterized protein n=1 Tax=Stephania yunnanensis TaxID=152371 RepID=A0AAP0ERI8_9MAGN
MQALDVNETDQQLSWLTNMLENTDSEWRIAIGFDPLVICELVEGEKVKKVFEPLLNIFLKFKVVRQLVKRHNICFHNLFLCEYKYFIVSGYCSLECIPE